MSPGQAGDRQGGGEVGGESPSDDPGRDTNTFRLTTSVQISAMARHSGSISRSDPFNKHILKMFMSPTKGEFRLAEAD